MKMGGLLAVNRGAVEEPRFVVMEYAPKKKKKHVALVGKGITFDSGGISIKPAEQMEEMKGQLEERLKTFERWMKELDRLGEKEAVPS